MTDPNLSTLRYLAKKQAEHYGPDYTARVTVDDEHAARNMGVRVPDFVRQVEGEGYRAGTPPYRRARTILERLVSQGKAVAYRRGNAYVFYWPVGMAETLRQGV